jgi:hypothetical protein
LRLKSLERQTEIGIRLDKPVILWIIGRERLRRAGAMERMKIGK